MPVGLLNAVMKEVLVEELEWSFSSAIATPIEVEFSLPKKIPEFAASTTLSTCGEG
jgi:hypothetical protein